MTETIDPTLNTIELRALLRQRARDIEQLTKEKHDLQDELRRNIAAMEDATVEMRKLRAENAALRKELEAWTVLPF